MKHMGYTHATHGIGTTSYLKWHGDKETANRLEAENMD